MIITPTTVNQLDIIGAHNLDRIKVLWEDVEPGKGYLTIICWGRAWTAYWGGMGGEVRQFVPTCNAGYIVENLVRNMAPRLVRNKKREEAYLERIVVVVQEALRLHLRQELHGAAA